jgi:hypothetical protein
MSKAARRIGELSTLIAASRNFPAEMGFDCFLVIVFD